MTATNTPTQTVTASITPTITQTNTPTQTVTPSVTASVTPTVTATNTPTQTVTATVTSSVTPTNTPTSTVTPSVTSTNTPTVTNTNTPTASVTASVTPTLTPTNTPTQTVTPSVTSTVTPTVTNTNTPTQTVSPSTTPTLTPSVTSSVTPTVTSTVTPTYTPTNTPSISVSVTPPSSPTSTPTSTVTPTVTATITPTNTITPTSSSTSTPTVTPTNTPTQTVSPSVTQTLTPSNTPTNTVTPSVTSTVTPTVTNTNTPTQTVTASVTQTLTPSNTPTNTPTVTKTATVTPTLTQSVTPSVTPESTVTPTVTQSVTPTDTPAPTMDFTATPFANTPTPTTTPTYTPTSSVTPSNTPVQQNVLIDDLGNYIITDDSDFIVMSTGPVPSPTPTTTATVTPTVTPSSSSPVTPTPSITVSVTPSSTADVTPTPTVTETPLPTPTSTPTIVDCYVAGPLITDSSNGAVFDRSVNVSGMLEVIAGAVGGQAAVPDEFSKKVARSFQLIMDPSATGITLSYQNNLVATLRGDEGTIHEGLPTAQRIGYGSGDNYDPNWLTDEGITGYTGYEEFLDTHAVNDMVWYQSGSTSGDAVITEVFEHIFHTVHLFGIMGAVPGSSTAVNWMAEENPNWQTTDLHLSMKQAIENGMYDPTDYAPNWNTDTGQAQVAYKEYMYLLNFGMWEMSEFWDGGSLSPEWNDNMRTPSGIQTNNILGYNLFNSYFAPVLTKPSFVTLRNIFQNNGGGVSGYFADDCITPTPTPSVTSSITPTPTPPFVNNLIVNLDARNTSSYPGTGTLWTDLQGNNNGTLVNGPTYNSTEKSIVTDGVNDYILLTGVAGTGTETQSFTYELWVKPDDTDGNIMSMSSANPQTDWNMPPIAAETGRFRGKIWSNNYLYSTTPFNQGQWYQVVLIWDFANATQSLYIDGVLNDSQSGVSYLSSGVDNNIFFGQQNPGADNTGDFRGEYGIIRLYNTALTSSQVLNNFNTTNPYP